MVTLEVAYRSEKQCDWVLDLAEQPSTMGLRSLKHLQLDINFTKTAPVLVVNVPQMIL